MGSHKLAHKHKYTSTSANPRWDLSTPCTKGESSTHKKLHHDFLQKPINEVIRNQKFLYHNLDVNKLTSGWNMCVYGWDKERYEMKGGNVLSVTIP